jgi:hypothetical protein
MSSYIPSTIHGEPYHCVYRHAITTPLPIRYSSQNSNRRGKYKKISADDRTDQSVCVCFYSSVFACFSTYRLVMNLLFPRERHRTIETTY